MKIEITSIATATIIDKYDIYFVEYEIDKVPQQYRTLRYPELFQFIEKINLGNYQKLAINPEEVRLEMLKNSLEYVIESYLLKYPYVQFVNN